MTRREGARRRSGERSASTAPAWDLFSLSIIFTAGCSELSFHSQFDSCGRPGTSLLPFFLALQYARMKVQRGGAKPDHFPLFCTVLLSPFLELSLVLKIHWGQIRKILPRLRGWSVDWEWGDLSLNLALGCVILGKTYFSFGTQRDIFLFRSVSINIR